MGESPGKVMRILKKTAEAAANIIRPETAHAHCDIPCGIYDPHLAQTAAHSVVRMAQLIKESPGCCSRYISEKEKSAELVKHEIRIIWGDYLKPEHFEKHPDLHDQANKINENRLRGKANQGHAARRGASGTGQQVRRNFLGNQGDKNQKSQSPLPHRKGHSDPRPAIKCSEPSKSKATAWNPHSKTETRFLTASFLKIKKGDAVVFKDRNKTYLKRVGIRKRKHPPSERGQP